MRILGFGLVLNGHFSNSWLGRLHQKTSSVNQSWFYKFATPFLFNRLNFMRTQKNIALSCLNIGP
ncbi:MAG: hypothetical protein A2527_00590 [Candidatus Lambdaproteobacteria bacterium RIFOXYD2_FULL_50_16]|uniref:Uncharacterized protein n=1 Tax=Candidatus Lambdaproteobacteria bacterium RIFOXYD2_FULL_50_16 TaxID=1817772 RepID=A0A1F6G8C4_9PROT|nr:MAG: hypothetical protein A2527_00590 [Candidatus Lambdaproteobacteria bacterium RIFOXYD2_FULL_50_16]